MNDKRIDGWINKEIDEAVDHLMKNPRLAGLSKETQDQMRQDLLERARNIVTHEGPAALTAFKKQYD
ncbi:MAG: hypothetical protein EPO55_00645 [Reyranella sp.]|uniref:hypothetical protein n=1 Tax=Reyranella sp. TaxID=1929291 RepID=UPI0011F7CF18|nr:hypothetical protein [Reyranella sp.]TAJ42769.1 MAG: hypothetical protein EPO55_00645 [Reyranella sp.]